MEGKPMLHCGVEFVRRVPSEDDPFICWWLHVAAGKTVEERRARLERCPEDLREKVAERVRAFFKELNKTRKGK
jgi:hypothetical protein